MLLCKLLVVRLGLLTMMAWNRLASAGLWIARKVIERLFPDALS